MGSRLFYNHLKLKIITANWKLIHVYIILFLSKSMSTLVSRKFTCLSLRLELQTIRYHFKHTLNITDRTWKSYEVASHILKVWRYSRICYYFHILSPNNIYWSSITDLFLSKRLKIYYKTNKFDSLCEWSVLFSEVGSHYVVGWILQYAQF